jgi:hypothetical protein
LLPGNEKFHSEKKNILKKKNNGKKRALYSLKGGQCFVCGPQCFIHEAEFAVFFCLDEICINLALGWLRADIRLKVVLHENSLVAGLEMFAKQYNVY